MLDTSPIGYAKDISNVSGSYFYSPATDLYLSYGYSFAQRLQFLRQEKIDPLDIECRTTRTQVSLEEVWGDAWSPGDPFQIWQQTRAKWNHDAIAKLLGTFAVAGKPILVTGQPLKIHTPPFAQTYLFPWVPGQELPSSPEDYEGSATSKASHTIVVRIQDDDNLDQRMRVAANLVSQIKKSAKPVVMDFTEVPPNRLEETVRTWLRKSLDPGGIFWQAEFKL